MEKKYQVFVSSTFIDLIEERKEVIQTLLELDCIPVGMELFPASDEDQWTFIKRVIDECDYYVLILAGRYGSCDSEGIGYTEKEYRYALESNKPIIAFLHQNIEELPAKKTEKDPELVAKLQAFRSLVKSKLCKGWSNLHELGGVVAKSIIQLKKRSPGIGWVRADFMTDEEAVKEILKLRNRIEKLEKEIEEKDYSAALELGELAQGEDKFPIYYSYEVYDQWANLRQTIEGYIEESWNDIFSLLGPHMFNEESEYYLKQLLINSIGVKAGLKEKFGNHFESNHLEIDESSFQAIKIQFLVLKLIQRGEKSRPSSDTETYWKLSSKGESRINQIMAIRKS